MRTRALLIAWTTLLAATAVAAPPAPSLKTLRVRALGEPASLDWNKASTWVEGFVLRNIMEGLVAISSDLKPIPQLAQSWSSSNEDKTWSFRLRPLVRWSDGVPLTAQDFVDSWKRLLNPDLKAKYASLLFDIEGAEDFYRGKLKDFQKVGIRAVGPSQIVVNLRQSNPHWYWIPTFYATFPIRTDVIARAAGGEWTRPDALRTLGPFQLESIEPGRAITLSRNPNYWGEHGNLDRIQMALVPDDATASKLYEVGQLDYLVKIPSLEQKRWKGKKDLRAWPDLRTLHLRLNTRTKPMSNVHLRRAVAMAIDRSKISKLFEGAYTPATTFVPAPLLAYSAAGGIAFDLSGARAELKASGLEPSKMPPLDLLTVSFDDQVILAQFIQEELRRNLGINVRIHILEPKRYYSPGLVHDDYAMQINFWGADYPDPDNILSIFLSNSGLNRYGWSNDEYDRAIRAGRATAHRREREKLYTAAQEILLRDQVATLPLFYGRISGLVRTDVTGLDKGPMDWWNFRTVSVSRTAGK